MVRGRIVKQDVVAILASGYAMVGRCLLCNR